MSCLEGLTIREWTRADVPTLVELELAIFAEDAWKEDTFWVDIKTPAKRTTLIAESEGAIVGYAALWRDGGTAGEATIANVAVIEDWRKRGVGRALVVALLQRADAEGFGLVDLYVRASNDAAIHLYETLGFRTFVRLRRHYPDNDEDAFVMVRSHPALTTPPEPLLPR